MKILLVAIISACVTWGLLYELFYGPKARVKRLWNEMFKYAYEIGKYKKESKDANHGVYDQFVSILESKSNKTGKLINAILEYEYQDENNEEEKEYVADNKYKIKS